jgi:hypothetical protein
MYENPGSRLALAKATGRRCRVRTTQDYDVEKHYSAPPPVYGGT